MPTEIYLVKVGMTMTEGMVAEWFVEDGGHVEKGDPVYTLETEKVSMEVEAETDGIVKHLVEPGVMMAPGEVVGYIFDRNEAIPDDVGRLPATPVSPEAVSTEEVNEAPMAQTDSSEAENRVLSSPAARRLAGELGVDYKTVSGTGPGGRVVEADVRSASGATTGTVKASPAARRSARELSVALSEIQGSGPGGRIVKEDVAAHAASSPAPQGDASQAERIPLNAMRRTIARRMHESLQNTAQLTMNMEVVMDEAVKLREQLIDEWQGENIRPTYTDMVVRAVAKSLGNHPVINSELADTEIIQHREIHVGIAVSLMEGLVVPVIRNTDRLSFKQTCLEADRLAVAARDESLGIDDYAGGTFTVTAMGMYGVDSFTPIINEPQAAILGVNRVCDGVSWVGDNPVKSKKMNLSLTWDHRILDGAPAAEFLGEVKELLESPYRLLV